MIAFISQCQKQDYNNYTWFRKNTLFVYFFSNKSRICKKKKKQIIFYQGSS